MKSTALLILLGAMAGCGPGAGEDAYPPPEQFAPVYAEMLLRATDSDSLSASAGSAREAQDSILASSGMTREGFNATVDWYNRDVTRWGDLLRNVVRYLEEKSTVRQGDDPPEGPGPPEAAQLI